MFKFAQVLAVSAIAMSANAYAGSRDAVAEAIKTNLVDKTFVTESKSSSRTAQGEEQLSEVARRWTITNVSKSSKGLAFDAIVNLQQTDTFTSASGQQTVRRRDRAMVVRFEAQELYTGALVGFARFVSYAGMEGKDPAGRGLSLSIKLEGNNLRMVYSDVAPSESKAGASGELRLITCDHTDEFNLDGANTTRKFLQQCYNVDPATFARGEALTPFRSEDTIQN
jgi:hypothetical protein